MGRILISCALVMLAASPIFSQEVVIKMGTLLTDPKPGHTPHHMISIQDYLVKRIRFHTKGQVELVILDGDAAAVPVRVSIPMKPSTARTSDMGTRSISGCSKTATVNLSDNGAT